MTHAMTHAMTLRMPEALYQRLRKESYETVQSITSLVIAALEDKYSSSRKGCDVCGKPSTHVTTPGGFRGCDEHFVSGGAGQ